MFKKIIIIGVLMGSMFIYGCNSNIGNEIDIGNISENKINKQKKYSLECTNQYYTNQQIGGNVNKGYIVTNKGNEKSILYINGDTAQFYGADYNIIQDDENYLIILRNYNISGLTETISINKKNGLGFDIKTSTLGILNNEPSSTTYIISCLQV